MDSDSPSDPLDVDSESSLTPFQAVCSWLHLLGVVLLVFGLGAYLLSGFVISFQLDPEASQHAVDRAKSTFLGKFAIGPALVGVILWVFAGRFLPASENAPSDGEEPPSPE